MRLSVNGHIFAGMVSNPAYPVRMRIEAKGIHQREKPARNDNWIVLLIGARQATDSGPGCFSQILTPPARIQSQTEQIARALRGYLREHGGSQAMF